MLPSDSMESEPLDFYNTVLGFHHLVENIDSCVVVQNQALYNTSYRLSGRAAPGVDEINKLISSQICDMSAGIRFPTELGTNARKLLVNI